MNILTWILAFIFMGIGLGIGIVWIALVTIGWLLLVTALIHGLSSVIKAFIIGRRRRFGNTKIGSSQSLWVSNPNIPSDNIRWTITHLGTVSRSRGSENGSRA
jgi:hypothetical protein